MVLAQGSSRSGDTEENYRGGGHNAPHTHIHTLIRVKDISQ